MKLGFIGAGNMATAIVHGILSQEKISAKDILISNHNVEKAIKLASCTGITACKSNKELAKKSEIIFLAVKPYVISPVLQEIKELILSENKTVVSIAAGINIETLERVLGKSTQIIRVMPNVNITVGEGATSVCGNRSATREKIDYILELFNTAGQTYELQEKDFSIFSAIAGASPAYSYLYIDALSRVAVKYGLPKEIATKIAAQSVLGSAKMIAESSDVPWALIDKVCSPGGTTVRGLLAIEEANFSTSITKAIDAVVARDTEIMEANK